MREESRLIQEAVRGERPALGELLALHKQSAFSLAVALCDNRQDAEDAVQEALMYAVGHIGTHKTACSFRAWLLKLVRSAAMDLKRAQQARRMRERKTAAEAQMAVENSPERRELTIAAHAALMSLEENYRLPVMMQCCQGLSRLEIAEILEMPPGTVATNVSRGLERLRESLSRAGFGAATLSLVLAQIPDPEVPETLSTALTKLVSDGVGAGFKPAPTGMKAASKAGGGWIVKIGLGILTLGLVAGSLFRMNSGESEEPKAASAAESATKPEPATVAPYDPTAQPDFKGPEVVSGPDEPALPGGAFNKEKYAFAQITGNFLDGSRESCMSHNYCESVWWLDDNTVAFGDNILNVVMVLEGDRLYRLAGSGVRGDKDGPAECAEFSFGVYVSPHPSLARLADGSFYLSDPLNGKIKKIFKKPDNRWWVETVAGGGSKTLKPGDSANGLEVQFQKGQGPHAARLCGPNRDHLYLVTGQSSWRATYVMSPDGKVTCVGAGEGHDLPLGFPPEKGYTYGWRGGNWASTCWKTSRADGTAVKVVGYTDSEIKAKEATGWKRPWDGPVDDCCIWTSGGPLRPDGRAMYLIGGDQLFLRRVMNGRILSLETKTGKWLESRDKQLNPNSIGCMNISRLTWDGYAYLTYAYGGQGMYRAKLYEPLKKPEGK